MAASLPAQGDAVPMAGDAACPAQPGPSASDAGEARVQQPAGSSAAQQPLRVLHVIGCMDRGGAETAIMNWYRALDPERIQFDFLVHETQACDYDDEIRARGGHIFSVVRFNGLNGAAYRRQVAGLLREHPEWAIVHGHIGSSAALYLSEAKKQGRVAIAHSHAQKFPLSVPQLGFRLFSYPTRHVADDFLACSEQAGIDRFGRAIARSPRFHVLENGIDIERYRNDAVSHGAAKARFGFGEGPVVGHVGRLTAIKNHEFIFAVFKEVLKRRPDAKLVLVGRGEREEELRRLAHEEGIAPSVIFFGVTDDVPSILKSFDGFMLPSFSEGLSLAAVEAQAAGVPALLSEGVPALAVAASAVERLSLGKPAALWADHLLALMDGRTDAYYHEAPRAVAEAGFSAADSARWLEAHYRTLLAKRGGSAV